MAFVTNKFIPLNIKRLIDDEQTKALVLQGNLTEEP